MVTQYRQEGDPSEEVRHSDIASDPCYVLRLIILVSTGWPPRTLGLLRGDRADAGQAEGRHRHRAGRPQVRQAGPGKVRE